MPVVSLVISAFQRPLELDALLSCLRVQRLTDWEAIVVHETPSLEIRSIVEAFDDPRIRYFEYPTRVQDWGNTCKEWGTSKAMGTFIGHSNDDNYYAPTYFEWLVHALEVADADFAFCDMVQSHLGYRTLETEPVVAGIDGGGWICRRQIVQATPWPLDKRDSLADGKFVEALVARCRNIVKVPAVLFVHN